MIAGLLCIHAFYGGKHKLGLLTDGALRLLFWALFLAVMIPKHLYPDSNAHWNRHGCGRSPVQKVKYVTLLTKPGGTAGATGRRQRAQYLLLPVGFAALLALEVSLLMACGFARRSMPSPTFHHLCTRLNRI